MDRDELNRVLTADLRNIILQAAPEREAEISSLWSRFDVEIRASEEESHFGLRGGSFGKIWISGKDARLIWLISFSSWQAVEAFAGYVWEQIASGSEIDFDAIHLTTAEGDAFRRYQEFLEKAFTLRDVVSSHDFVWPPDIPFPGPDLDRNALTISERASYDLAHFTMAFVVLHELRHVIFALEGNAPAPKDEELLCDAFACDFMLTEVERYSAQSGEPALAVYRKRAIAVILGLTLPLTVVDVGYWNGTTEHPSLRQRIQEITERIALPPNDLFWIYSSTILMARLQSQGRLRGTRLTARNAREVFSNLLNRI
jgi:hypothetical protein